MARQTIYDQINERRVERLIDALRLSRASGVAIENLAGDDVEKLAAPVQAPRPKRRRRKSHPILRVSSSRHDHPEPEDWFRGIPNSETPEASPVVRQSQKRACPPSAIASSLPEAHSSFFQGIYFGKFEFKGSDDGHHFQVQVYLDDLDSGGQAAEKSASLAMPGRGRFAQGRAGVSPRIAYAKMAMAAGQWPC